MRTYLLRRVLTTIPVLIGVTMVVFSFVAVLPGDPTLALLPPEASLEQREELRRSLGFDQPIPVQYVSWLGRALQGDLGRSIETKQPVAPIIATGFKNSLILTVTAFAISLTFGLLIGILSATRPRSVFDRLTMLIALFGTSMPAFWLGIMLILIFAVQLRWFPVGGMYDVRSAGGLGDLLWHLVLPSVTLGMLSLAIIARMTRSSMLEVIRQDFIRTARAKGLRERATIGRHALKNALLPIVTIVGVQLGLNLGGAVLTETVFSWPGLGRQMYRAIGARDLPLIQAGVLVLATTFVMINLVVDLIYAYLDPRIRYR